MTESFDVTATTRLAPSNVGAERLKVVHLPVYSENPYQPLLMKSLAEQGFDVVDGGGGGNFLRTALFRWRADLYHFHWLHPYLLRKQRIASIVRATRFVLETLLIRLSGARIVWTVHNLVNHDQRFPAIERWYSSIFAQFAHGVIVHSEGTRLAARKAFKLSKSKRVAVIPQGSYVEYYPNNKSRAECRAELGLPGDAFVFLFLGRIEPYKGVIDLVGCFRELPGNSILLIAGRASNRELLARLRDETNGAPNIRLEEGFVSDEDIQRYFKASDVFVLPARHILNSSSLVLAVSFGLPCIAPGLRGVEEMLGAEGGIFYDSLETRGLLSAMKSAIERKQELPAMGRNNLKRARENDWAAVAARTAAFYRLVAGRSEQSA